MRKSPDPLLFDPKQLRANIAIVDPMEIPVKELAERVLKIPEGALRPPGETGRFSALEGHEHEPDNWVMRTLKRFYMPLFAFSLRRKRVAVTIGAVVVVLSLAGGAVLVGTTAGFAIAGWFGSSATVACTVMAA